jgi:pimeloyl-ACP methyl ester carboxylesterase
LLHGFPESSFSFHKVVDGLAGLFDRVVLFDFPAYGLCDKPLANYTYFVVREGRRRAARVERARREGGHVLSHGMKVARHLKEHV